MGFTLGIFLMMDQTFGWRIVAHPYLNSFLHRSILVWLLAAFTMVAVSLLTPPPPAYKLENTVFGSTSEKRVAGSDYRIWAAVLFACTLVLWWCFR